MFWRKRTNRQISKEDLAFLRAMARNIIRIAQELLAWCDAKLYE